MTVTHAEIPLDIKRPSATRIGFRFGVALRLLIAIAAITMLAIVVSAVALFTFDKYKSGFARIASSNIPALVAASDLAQRSQALAANAPNLAVVDGHFARRAVSESLQNQLKSIAQAGSQVRKFAPATPGLENLARNETSLKENLEKLDRLVADKLESDRVAVNFMLRLGMLSSRVRAARTQALPTISDEPSARGQIDALTAWTAAADQAIVVMLSTSSADTKVRLNRLRLDFGQASDRQHSAREHLSSGLVQAIDPLERTLAQYGRGSPNIFDVRAAQLASASAVHRALLDTKEAATRFVESADRVFAEVQKDARGQSDYFSSLTVDYSRLFMALSFFCVVGAAVVFLHINRSVISRLRALSDNMRRSADGTARPILISGDDEIADMAKAADFFASSLAQREQGLRESVAELRALGEVTQAVNSSVDLETVLTTIVAKATQLSGTEAGAIYVFDDAKQEFQLRATYGLDESIVAELRSSHIRIGQTGISEAIERGTPFQVADIQNDPTVTLDVIVRAGFRALLYVPLVGAEKIVGALVVRRKAPGEFPRSTVELLQTFAAQSVLAIQNARLFDSVETRTRELAQSLEDLKSTQDRLVQTEKLASLGQLTAGIAHEIENPLNFVNNFSAVSVELIDELRQGLAGPLDDKLRAQISEIADMLQGNLDKVVQHGKRADAIVKNMLLHSRQGSGEHRPVDINALVEESLNLAYHGARAEQQGFNITLERSLDPSAGEVDVFPQDVTRVLLNLVSNGFYAATKRKSQADGGDYEPTLMAATRNLGGSVEIRIRDNGTGIPPDVKEKMFNPFYTTKPTGEGTGLGLSISHDIIVKQHGGSIEVDTTPGEFTEIKITLPRSGVFPSETTAHA
jgi:signal transduction histidine kinase